MRTNNNLVDFSKEYTYVASESLVQEAKEKHSNIYLNFAYTDYGGSFLDKVIISYFKEYLYVVMLITNIRISLTILVW